MQEPPIAFPENSTTTGTQNGVRRRGQLVNHRGFDVSKVVFALALKEGSNGATQPLLEHSIGVSEMPIKPLRELTTDC